MSAGVAMRSLRNGLISSKSKFDRSPREAPVAVGREHAAKACGPMGRRGQLSARNVPRMLPVLCRFISRQNLDLGADCRCAAVVPERVEMMGRACGDAVEVTLS